MNRSIDYSALTEAVTSQQLHAFKAEAKASGRSWATVNPAQLVVVVIGVVVVGFITISSVGSFAAISLASMSEGANPVGIIGTVFPLVFLLAFIGFAVVVARSVFGSRSWETWYRLSRFAASNGMIFSPSDANPRYPGAIFTIGDSRRAVNHLQSATDRYLDIGNYYYSTGSGKSRSTHSWGFMALHLDRKLPNMVLDSRANNGLFGGTNLPAFFAKDQVLALEGDFNKHFTLYCPKQYERDALYVFTPDLMALLIDEAAPYDVEIVDDWMFVYSAAAFASTSPAVYQRLFRIVDTVGAKALAQTDRYVDERIGDFAANMVAPHGQRLKRGVSVATIIFVVVFAAIWVLPHILDFFS